jgi:hypothetical protein
VVAGVKKRKSWQELGDSVMVSTVANLMRVASSMCPDIGIVVSVVLLIAKS